MLNSILALAFLFAASTAEDGRCTTGFSVVAPEAAVPGKTTAVLVTLHGRSGKILDPLNVTVRLETQDSENEARLLTTASQMITSFGIIPLKIPSSPATHCTLHTTVGCAANDECTSKSHTLIRLLGPVRDVIIKPAKHHYRPGDTITFWLLALDHDLRLVHGELAYVALIDPAGTKVAIWEQLSLDEGVRKLSTILANAAKAGTWRLEASCGGGSARVELTVSSGTSNPAPAAPAAEQHYVELRFADNMRRRYKPGLPFVGRVEAMSTEKKVRVRVKLYDDQTDIYSQDIDMSSGEGMFVVPTVMADAPFINLQAELVAVEGKEIETHYVLAREKIHRWNSTSKCYLLIENLPTPLQAGNLASVSIWSSCGCQERLLAAVTSGGRAVHWAPVPAPNDTSVDLCRFNYTFPVTPDMAPVSSLLVYYVTPAGDPVSDVATFHVKLLHKEVAVAIEERRWWYPRATLQLRVLAPSDSTLCLIGARAPVDNKFDTHQASERETEPGPEFVSAGVSLFVGGGACGGGVLYRQRTSPGKPVPAHLVPPASHDRLWMWKCFNYTTQLSTDGVTIAAPSEAGRWSIWALSLSNRGLRFSSPKTINVFRPIQLDFTLPPALKVGETVEVDVKITNNINNCMDVTALLALSAGASFASTGALYVTERLRLGPKGGTQLVVRVAVDTPGRKNITVEVTGYSADNCSVSYTSFNNETLVGSVIRSASVLVLPEGLHRSDTQSAYFCANEHLAVSTRGSWEWQWLSAPRNRAGLVLELRAQGAAHMALSSIKEPSEAMYRVVFERNKVWIARGKHGYDVHLASAEQTDDEECSSAISWCAWWVWWEGGRLAVGRGAVPNDRRLLVWPLAQDMRIEYVGFSSMWGDRADFRIWNFNEEAGFSQVLELGLPHGVVPGSTSGTLLISGGLHLPLYSFQADAADQWGEVWRDSQLTAAAASVAPLLALEHIPHLVDEAERERILKKLPEQVQILLSFRKTDNSFSDHPAMSSHTSTIQVLEILSKIQSYYPVDPALLESIKKWIHIQQQPDGSFEPLAGDIEVNYNQVNINKLNNTDMEVNEYYYYDKDGSVKQDLIDLEKKVEMTAETLSTILEVGVESQRDAIVAKKAQTYLEKNLHNLTSPSALAATVLALVLSRSPLVPDALIILKNASTTEEGEFGWPPPKKNAADWLLEDNSNSIKTSSYEAVTMEQYVAGVRVLLAACARGALSEGEDAARFLYYRASTLQKHPGLAYVATKAAAQFAALAHDKHRALTVSLATAGMELTDTLELKAKTSPRLLQLPGLPTKVFVYATGAGCATVQGTITYSTYLPKSENSLLSIQSAIIEEIRAERSSIEDLQGNLPTLNIKTCFRWKSKERSGILRLEVSLFSGYELHSVNPVVLDKGTFADLHHGSRGESAWFVFANISSACPVCITYQARSHYVIKGLRPAFAKIFPASRPDLSVETFFHAKPGSPLLRGITDDDFITWFDKTELASLRTNSYDDNICECGRLCNKFSNNKSEDTIVHLSYPVPKKYLNKMNGTEKVILSKSKSLKNSKIAWTILPTQQSQTTTFKLLGEKISTTEWQIPKKIIPITTAKVTAITEIPSTAEISATTEVVSNITKWTLGDIKFTRDDPIIIPTATYANQTKDEKLDNHVTPMIPRGGELIVQNVPLKTFRKDIELRPKPSPRRKGTLKSTYGDDHEKFFNNVQNASFNIAQEPNQKNYTQKYFKKIGNFVKKALRKLTGNYTTNATKVNEKVADYPGSILKSNNISIKIFSNSTTHPINNILNINSMTSNTTHYTTIAAVTNSNIQNLFRRTKKPKAMNQIKKPAVHNDSLDSANSTMVQNNASVVFNHNETNIDNAAQELQHTKLIKSINKEIHKVPVSPISETSKILTERNVKSDLIAPELKTGYEMIDKNNVWGLLKEKTQITPLIDDKLQVHKTINAQTMSSSNKNRPL